MKKQYVKPAVIVQKEIEALAGTCLPGNGGDTGDKTAITEGECQMIIT